MATVARVAGFLQATGTMDARAAPLRRRRRWWWVGGEAAVGAQADEDGDRSLGQELRQLRGIVAGVEDEQVAPPQPPTASRSLEAP